MNLVIYIVSGLFIVLTLALLFAYYRTRQPGLVLISSTYGSAAVLALMFMEWWPLAAGFALAWVLRLMGLDPGSGREADK
jgi:hypothetical protein